MNSETYYALLIKHYNNVDFPEVRANLQSILLDAATKTLRAADRGELNNVAYNTITQIRNIFCADVVASAQSSRCR